MLKNNHIKKHTYESQNTWHSFFAYSLFQILKKAHLQILAKFFAYYFFKYLKAYLQTSKYLEQFFCLFPFLILKKRMLTNPSTIFCSFFF